MVTSQKTRDSYSVISNYESTILSLVFVICFGVVALWYIIFEYLEIRQASWFSGTQKYNQGMSQGENASLCYNLNMEYSSPNTFSIVILVPIFNGCVSGTITESITYSFLLPLTKCFMPSWQNQNLCSMCFMLACCTLLLEWSFLFILPLALDLHTWQ